ncbi:hypothetical protein NBRC116494_04060 [Aurantivibrio plasticivorans]
MNSTSHKQFIPFIALLVLVGLIVCGLWFAVSATPDSLKPTRTVKAGLVVHNGEIPQHDSNAYTDDYSDDIFYVLLREIAKPRGWYLDYTPCQWFECIDLLKQGEIDVLPAVTYSAERDALFDFHSISVLQSWSQVYTNPGAHIRNLDDLAGLTIATPRGSIQATDLQQAMSSRGLTYNELSQPSTSAALDALRSGRATAAIVDNILGRRLAHEFNVIETPISLNQAGLFFATPEGTNADLLMAFDQQLATWKGNPDSVYFDTFNKQLTSSSPQRIPTWLISTLLITTASVVVLITVVLFLRWSIKARTAQIQSTNQRLHHLMNSSSAIIYSLDPHTGHIRWISDNVLRITGFTVAEACQAKWWINQLHPEDRDTAIATFKKIFSDKHITQEYRFIDKTGNVRFVRDELQLTSLPGNRREIIGTLSDLTDDYKYQAEVSFLREHDSLTGLPNRTQLFEKLTATINESQRNKNSFSIICIDLDRFKNINDSLGVEFGDKVLLGLTKRLESFCRTGETLARSGADQFVLLLPNHGSVQVAERTASSLLHEIRRPLNIDKKSLIITSSIGICLYPENAERADQAIHNAELAMFAAKEQGGNSFAFYQNYLAKISETKFRLENDLRHAIANEELQLYYQPQYGLRDLSLTGVEVLIRWEHPTQGFIPPSQFIPLAEEIGVIAELDTWVMHQTFSQLLSWDNDIGFKVPRISLNLSAAELDDHNLVNRFVDAIEDHNLSADRIELEVTESALMRSPDTAIRILRELHLLGIKISMDDFGTGYSNLAHLGRLPIDCLKIDRSFVQQIGKSHYSDSLIRAIIAMGQALDLKIIAEGIETTKQQRFLFHADCHIGQGYLLSKPLSADAMSKHLQELKTQDTQRSQNML